MSWYCNWWMKIATQYISGHRHTVDTQLQHSLRAFLNPLRTLITLMSSYIDLCNPTWLQDNIFTLPTSLVKTAMRIPSKDATVLSSNFRISHFRWQPRENKLQSMITLKRYREAERTNFYRREDAKKSKVRQWQRRHLYNNWPSAP